MNTVDLIRTAAANTFRGKLRTTLTVLALVVGAATLALTTALGAGVSDYMTKQVTALGAADLMLITKVAASTGPNDGPQRYDPSTSTASSSQAGSGAALTEADVEKLAAIPGLHSVQPIKPVAIDWVAAATSDKYELSIQTNASVTHADLAAGRQLDATSSEHQVILPGKYLKALHLGSAAHAVGTDVTLGITDVLGKPHTVQATIVGIAHTSLFNSGAGANTALIDDLTTLQKAGVDTPNRYQLVVARFDPNSSPSKVDALKSKISDAGMTGQTIADQLGLIQTVISGITGVLNAFAIVALIAAAFGIVNTLLMSVQERTREIGLMKAMGMSGGRIFALFSLEAGFIGLLGSAIGVGVAMLIGFPLSSALEAGPLSGLQGLQLLLFTPATAISVIALIMVIALLAGTLPARRAARKTPIDALRYE